MGLLWTDIWANIGNKIKQHNSYFNNFQGWQILLIDFVLDLLSYNDISYFIVLFWIYKITLKLFLKELFDNYFASHTSEIFSQSIGMFCQAWSGNTKIMISIKKKVGDIEYGLNNEGVKPLSKVVQRLLKLRFIPVKEEGASFKFFSPVTLTHIIIYFGILVFYLLFLNIFGKQIWIQVMENINKGNATVNLSTQIFNFLLGEVFESIHWHHYMMSIAKLQLLISNSSSSSHLADPADRNSTILHYQGSSDLVWKFESTRLEWLANMPWLATSQTLMV